MIRRFLDSVLSESQGSPAREDSAERFSDLATTKPPQVNLKILHLHVELRETSCANQFCLASQHDISVVTFFKSTLTLPRRIKVFDGDGSIPGFRRALRAALADESYDVVHAHGPIDGFLFLAFTALRGGVHAAKVLTIHNSYDNLGPRNRILLFPVVLGFDEVVCCSLASLQSFNGLYRWLTRNRLCAIQNGVDVDRVGRAVNCFKRSTRGRFTIVSVGRLIPIKDPITLLTAYRASDGPASLLTFIGEGPLARELGHSARRLRSRQSVEFAGLLKRDDVYRRLATADLFVSSSRGEGLPLATLEAMSAGCPVVLTDIDPHREIASGVDFIPLVRVGDAGALADQITRFRQMDPAQRREIGAQCRALVNSRFSAHRMLDEYDRVYRQALQERSSGDGAVHPALAKRSGRETDNREA